MLFLAAVLPLIQAVTALSLSVASSGGNSSSQLLYGLLYEDIYHSGDGGLYGEMLRNRAFQGSGRGRIPSFNRNTDFWHPVGGVSLSIDQSSPVLSSSLQYHLKMDVPAGTKGTVGFYNDGFWGFHVDAAKRYIASMYVRGDYNGEVECYFRNNISGQKLSSSKMSLNQKASDGWKQTFSPTFTPTVTPSNGNNTFYFTFDGSQLAGKSIYINLFSLFKQTYNNRINGNREDLMMSLAQLNTKWIRLPGGNNMEGLRNGQEWKWNQTIGDLKTRPGMLGVWGDINTDGFGLLEQMQMAQDLNLTVILGVHAGLYLNGDVASQSQMQSYVDMAMNELEFLTGDKSTTNGAKRAALGYPSPFKLQWVEIGNEDYLNNGYSSYYDYRFMALYDAIRGKYPTMNLISTINPSPSPDKGSGGMIDLHIYDNENHFVGLYNTFDQASRDYPVFVAEYAVIRAGTGTGAEIGAQTFGMACAEAIFLLGCERNSDIIVGSAYGALIKHYDEEPNTVAVVKHTATEVLHTMSFYVQKLFADYMGTQTLPVTATNGGVGPIYWSATKGSQGTILKLVNYNGQTGNDAAVKVTFKGSSATTAKLTFLSAPSSTSVNNLPSMGGEASQITVQTITAQNGQFSVAFTKPYQIAILTV
ncbi:glycoside hydrolase superfamily [Dactylonectria macrodidyma]|uniref:non-reducing end alpha-L-arabinofuranosidase n=1 Tax=Dactylonectria macrodidyma TaxID=307937 RepID=A0A9P9IQJ8_9HYPO|nr:glycoside hydrolase superfamily [Dactylonectria macrodidyma]